jgi:hypothetical protein
MKKKVSELNIQYFDSLGLESDTSIFWINACTNGKPIKISFAGILHISLSQNFSDIDEPDFTVIDVKHEIRHVTPDDLKDYICGYTLDDVKSSAPYHIINFIGNTMLFIICKDYKVTENE